MKLKTLLLAGIVSLVAYRVYSAVPTFSANSGSTYVISQSSVSISSMPIVSVGGVFGGLRLGAVNGWREVKIQLLPTPIQDGTSVFYTLNGSTNNIYALGYQVRVSTLVQGVAPAGTAALGLGGVGPTTQNEITIESNGQINVMTAPGVPAIAGRVIQKRIPQ